MQIMQFLAVLLHEKSHPRQDDFFVDVVTISVANTGVWSDNFPQKPIAASHRCGSLFFVFLFYSIFQLESTCKKKAPALLPLLRAAISWREKKFFYWHFLTAAIFCWPLCDRWAEKTLSFVSCIYLYLIYIIGRSRSGSSSCSSLIAFSATWKPINWYF